MEENESLTNAFNEAEEYKCGVRKSVKKAFERDDVTLERSTEHLKR